VHDKKQLRYSRFQTPLPSAKDWQQFDFIFHRGVHWSICCEVRETSKQAKATATITQYAQSLIEFCRLRPGRELPLPIFERAWSPAAAS
jgi:hypothetical protein